jgi:hypothetical protein
MKVAHDAANSAIREVNERLAAAHQLIVAGRRAEAIEIAETPPHVIDEIAIWDSQLIRDWEYWSSQFGLPRLTRLRGDLASLLHGAYTTEHQLEHLLGRHRLLAIGRANLRQRIAVLSQLATADPSNPQWNRALVECQRRRLDQLAERTTQGHKHDDLQCLQQIAEELRQTRWLTPVSNAQLETVQRQITRLRGRQSTIEAIALAEHLQDAFASKDKTRLLPLIERWTKIEPYVDRLAMSDDLPSIQSVIEWYDQDARQQQEAKAQSTALDRADTIKSDSESAEIRSVIDGIASTGADTPAKLREAYMQRVARETRGRRWKAGLITSAIATVVFALAFWLRLTYMSYQRDVTLTKKLTTIDQKLTVGQLAAADQLLSEVPGDDERFDEARTRLQEQQLVEDRRAAEFQAEATAVRKAIDDARQIDAFDSLTSRVSQLADRAKKNDEHAMASEIAKEAKAAHSDRKMVVMDEARGLILKIREDLERLKPDDDARGVLTGWNRQLLETRTDRWLGNESSLLAELAATSEAVADRREAIRQMAKNRAE